MTDIHSCSYYCDKPECIKAQRNELREKLEQRKPITDEIIVETFCKALHHNQHIVWFAAGVRYAEVTHGIKE